jgi:hypothetical protein
MMELIGRATLVGNLIHVTDLGAGVLIPAESDTSEQTLVQSVRFTLINNSSETTWWYPGKSSSKDDPRGTR